MSRRDPSSRTARHLAVVVLAAAVPLAAAGCGSSSSSSSSSAAAGAAVNTPPASAKLPPRLTANLNPAGAVTLTNAAGTPVTDISSGRYTLSIDVESKRGDFRLVGPMINRRTRRHFTGVVLWGVHLVPGTYHYMNDEGRHPKVHVLDVS
jgi:hypothetical protein